MLLLMRTIGSRQVVFGTYSVDGTYDRVACLTMLVYNYMDYIYIYVLSACEQLVQCSTKVAE